MRLFFTLKTTQGRAESIDPSEIQAALFPAPIRGRTPPAGRGRLIFKSRRCMNTDYIVRITGKKTMIHVETQHICFLREITGIHWFTNHHERYFPGQTAHSSGDSGIESTRVSRNKGQEACPIKILHFIV
jgi:hypothetical protein